MVTAHLLLAVSTLMVVLTVYVQKDSWRMRMVHAVVSRIIVARIIFKYPLYIKNRSSWYSLVGYLVKVQM